MKNKYVLIEIVVIICIVCAAIYNMFANCSSFWNINITQVLTMIIAVCIAFEAAQFKNDERKLKEQAEKIIAKIQFIVNEPAFTSFPNSGDGESLKRQNRIAIRKLHNCINILKEYSNISNISNDVDYIEEQYKSYNDFVSEHPDDLDYLSKSEIHLKKYAENIDSKCDQLLLKLYKK